MQASAADYAELAVATTTYYCLDCGPIMREHFPDGSRITWHLPIPHHPVAQLHGEEFAPVQ